MPIVKTREQGIGGKLFKVQVRVLKDGLFHIKLPDYVAEALGYKEVEDKTMRGVEDKLHDTLKLYQESNTKVTRVICYDIDITARIWDEEREELLLDLDEVTFTEGMALQVYAEVFEEEKITGSDGSVRYHYKSNQVMSNEQLPESIVSHSNYQYSPNRMMKKAEHCMDWTQQRFDFFARLAKAMEKLILDVHRIGDQDKLIEAIDKGVNLLMAPREEIDDRTGPVDT